LWTYCLTLRRRMLLRINDRVSEPCNSSERPHEHEQVCGALMSGRLGCVGLTPIVMFSVTPPVPTKKLRNPTKHLCKLPGDPR
jgi:hypothetical protein